MLFMPQVIIERVFIITKKLREMFENCMGNREEMAFLTRRNDSLATANRGVLPAAGQMAKGKISIKTMRSQKSLKRVASERELKP